MKIKWFRRIFLAITFISSVVTVSLITFKVVQKNNLEVEAKANNKSYRPVQINKSDFIKLLDYKNSNYIFNLRNTEYYLVHKTLELYPELANKTFSFSTNIIHRPTKLVMTISGSNEMKWFYSIINKQKS